MQRTYRVKDRKITLEVDPSRIGVRFEEPAPRSMRAETLEKADVPTYRDRLELPKEKFTIVPLDRGPHVGGPGAATAKLSKRDAVKRVAEVYRVGNQRAVATDRLTIGLTAGTDPDAIFGELDVEVLESFGDNEHLVRLKPNVDPIERLQSLAGDTRIDYAEPDFVTFGRHIAQRLEPRPARLVSLSPASPGSRDSYLAQQYAVFITKADVAWQSVNGDPGVSIAILDEGVETDHPDLAGAIAGTYDATDDDAWQEPNGWDGHGTACAGLAAAVPGNGIGIRGIGGGCSLLAARIAFSEKPGGHWIYKDHWVRRAVQWSMDMNVDIMSNSWGGGPFSQQVANAIERARSKGRGGKGAIVVAAAGNDGWPVSFPAYLPGVLTVSASNQYDEAKTRSSKDGENWATNLGPEVDVAAPGVANLTTDNVGFGGYASGDYDPGFNGTSSSTPIVAGACGLLLSVDPSLTEAEVRAIVRETADKVGQFPYVKGRNDHMGHGRLNVAAAVDEARRRLTS